MSIETYHIERSKLTEHNLDEIFRICSGNPVYFEHMRETLCMEKLAELLTALPSGANPANKKNIGFHQQGRLVGYLELIESFPERDHVLIGFFIIEKTAQCKGLGSAVIDSVLAGYAEKGFKIAILSHASTDEKAKAFWLKNRFVATGEIDDCEDIELVVMERNLAPLA